MSAGPKNNDFSILIANVNGTGSASANHLFAKAIFRMGIPVSPRNIFPSNIQGLPTCRSMGDKPRPPAWEEGTFELSLGADPYDSHR